MLARGRYQQAHAEFLLGGDDGGAYARHLDQALQIHSRLRSVDPEFRGQAVFLWETWLADHPGPRIWREEATLVSDYAETADVYSIERDIVTTYYKSRPSSPVWLEVLGPGRLKLEARPVHGLSDSPIDDRLHIKGDTQHFVNAIAGNRPASGLRIVGDCEHVPGWKVKREFDVGPGLHRINVAAESVDVLVRVLASRPELPIPVLPPLTRETLNAVLGGTYARREAPQFGEMNRQFVQFLPMSDTGFPSLIPITRPVKTRHIMVNPQSAQLTSETVARLALRTGQSISELRDHPGEWKQRTAPTRQVERTSFRFRTPIERTEIRSTSGADNDILDQVQRLLYQAETDPASGWKSRVEGLQLCSRHPRIRRVQNLRQRLKRKTEWSRFQQFTSSAGVRTVQLTGWFPESPSVRIRQALLPRLSDDEHMISGDRRLVLSLNILDPTVFRIELRSAQIEFVAPTPMTVAFQQDDQPVQQFSLSPAQPEHAFQIAVDGGTHQLKVWIAEPLANQFLRLKIVERSRDAGEHQNESAIVREQNRVYEVATHAEPVRFEIRGPAWIRIDEWRDGITLTNYEAVLEENRTIELHPLARHKQALFRVYELVRAVNSVRHATHWERTEPVPVPDPLITLPTDRLLDGAVVNDEPAGVVRIHDAFPLGGQESATWAAGLSIVRRRPLEEGIDGRQPDEFLQFGITRSYFDQWRHNYWRTNLLFRQREAAGPSVGIRHAFRHDGDVIPLTAILEGAAYVQNPGGASAPANSETEWSAFVRGRLQQSQQITPIFSHLPSISVFGRLISLDRNVYAAGRLDQDIFTPYKTNHRHGTTLSETFSLRPWIDTRLLLRGSLTSNEDFNIASPDHISLRTGWAQALGPLTVAASYRLTRFFQDDDRANARLQNLVYLDTFADWWPTFYNRSELGFRLQHDLDRGSTSAWLSLNWFFDNGRDYRDLMPGEIEFRNLRMQRASQRWNNEIFPLHRRISGDTK